MLGRWRLETKLGEGATSNVWAATDSARRIQVALKVLKTDEVDEQLAMRRHMRMKRESEALMRSQHPNVVRIVEFGNVGKRVFLAMELIDGVDLAVWLKDKRTWQEIIAVFLQCAMGLGAAHRAGIVHRDFKPANVMVGRDGRVAVTDFGLARSDGLESDGAALGVKLTAGGVAVGTPRYMAPEQHQALPTDPRTDQFAWGVALFEALYGQHPYAPSPRTDVSVSVAYALATMAGRISPPPEPDPPIPPAIAAAVRKAIETQQSNRFGSMDEIVHAIHGTITAQAAAHAAVGKKRSLTMFVAGGVAITGIAAGITVGTLGTRPPECRASYPAIVAKGPLAEPLAAWSTWWTKAQSETCAASRAEGARARLACLSGERTAIEAMLASPAPAAVLGALETQCADAKAAVPTPPRDVADAVDRVYADGRPESWLALVEILTKADAQGLPTAPVKLGDDALVKDAAVRGRRREGIGRVLLAYGRRAAAIAHLSAAVSDLGADGARAAEAWVDAEIASAAADAGLGDLVAAEARITALIEKAAEPLRPRALESRAWIRGARGEWGAAITDAREAVRMARETLGESHPAAIDALFALGSVEAGSGAIASATPKLEEVVKRRAAQSGPRRAEAMFALARATAKSSPDRGRALAAEARTVATGDSALIASIDAWLGGR